MRESRLGLVYGFRDQDGSCDSGSACFDSAPKSKKGEVEKKVLLGRPGNNLKVSFLPSLAGE